MPELRISMGFLLQNLGLGDLRINVRGCSVERDFGQGQGLILFLDGEDVPRGCEEVRAIIQQHIDPEGVRRLSGRLEPWPAAPEASEGATA